ncbi:hypothetical protein BD410DRAFT_781772 [Rickenella mellea]|uniref:Uncharacterized protein n=1 Tax=Rickenella mellea TaxID=50990 RepID=A0A4Y7QJK8_9AGAM|nr:hypothetical protein BD410DRAFT_781772 [Rickenella mellea]
MAGTPPLIPPLTTDNPNPTPTGTGGPAPGGTATASGLYRTFPLPFLYFVFCILWRRHNSMSKR